ncbi:MAG: response regulator [Solirubrobacteraceae bacterium]
MKLATFEAPGHAAPLAGVVSGDRVTAFGGPDGVREDGEIALNVLGQQSVGMVLLDIRMPRRDGLSVLEALPAPQLVVLASGHALDEATLARAEAKIVTFLEKPVPPERLLDVVATTLGRSPADRS